jgi:hypothetical protein
LTKKKKVYEEKPKAKGALPFSQRKGMKTLKGKKKFFFLEFFFLI